jgi:predicted RecA/RadA family phage recombinase
MEATFYQKGKAIDYTAANGLSVGQVVSLTNIVGVAMNDVASGAVGAVALEGIYLMPAASGITAAIGDKLYWDDTNNVLTTTSTANAVAGINLTTKATAAANVYCKINVG